MDSLSLSTSSSFYHHGSYDPPSVRYDSGQSLQCFTYSPHLNQIAIGGRDIRLLSVNHALTSIVPVRSGSFSASVNHTSITDVCYHPHAADCHWLLAAPTTGAILLYDVHSGGLKRSAAVYEGHSRAVNRLRWSPVDQSLFVSGSQDGSVRLWDTRHQTRRSVNDYTDNSSVRDIAFSPINGTVLAAAYENGSVSIIDVRLMRPMSVINAHQNLVLTVDWHPIASDTLATGSMDRTIKVWDTQPPTVTHPVHSINVPHSVGIIKWRPNHGYQLAACASSLDSEITVYNLYSPYIPLGVLSSHRDIVTGLVFTHAGDSVLTCSKDGTVQRNNLSQCDEPLLNLSVTALAFNHRDQLATINERMDRLSLINIKNPPNIFPQHFQHIANSGGRKGVVNVIDVSSAMMKSSLSASAAVPVTRHSDSEAFEHCARHYRLFDGTIAELCDHNYTVALAMERYNIAHVWAVVKLLYGDEAHPQQRHDDDDDDDDDSHHHPNPRERRRSSASCQNDRSQLLHYANAQTKSSVAPSIAAALLSALPDVHSSHCYQRFPAPPHSEAWADNDRYQGLLELSSYRQQLLYNAMTQLVNIDGDVQTASSLTLLLQPIVHFPISATRAWLHSYIELLHRCALHSEAALIASHSEDEWIARHTAHSTTFTLLCAQCRHTSRTVGTLCTECHSVLSMCSVCQLPVNGVYVWCQGCAHGGHVDHWNEWFQSFTVCPTGCLHQCVPSLLQSNATESQHG